MPALLKEWKVLPHGRLSAVEDNILTVVGEISMPALKFPRRMTVVRLNDGRLVIYSAIALDEDEMRELEKFGTPAFLIVPSDHHRLDAKIWQNRYPAILVIAPKGACEKVQEAVAVDATHADFGDPNVKLVTVPGTGEREAALEILNPTGTTLVVNDIVANIRDPSGFGGFVSKLMGFAGDTPQVPRPERWTMIGDKAALAVQLRRWADLPSLKRILVSHGEPIERDPKGALRELAATLE